MNGYVVTNSEDDKAISLIKTLGMTNNVILGGDRGISPYNVETVSSHADAIEACSTSKSKRCFITEGGIGIGHQSLSHVVNEVSTMSDTTDLVVFGNKTYVLTRDLAQSWVNREKSLNLERVHEACSNIPCQKYESPAMKTCQGYGLFQDCNI